MDACRGLSQHDIEYLGEVAETKSMHAGETVLSPDCEPLGFGVVFQGTLEALDHDDRRVPSLTFDLLVSTKVPLAASVRNELCLYVNGNTIAFAMMKLSLRNQFAVVGVRFTCPLFYRQHQFCKKVWLESWGDYAFVYMCSSILSLNC